jgi:hypothetical protein
VRRLCDRGVLRRDPPRPGLPDIYRRASHDQTRH